MLNSENEVLTHAGWKGVLGIGSGFREAEEHFSAKLMALDWEEPSIYGES